MLVIAAFAAFLTVPGAAQADGATSVRPVRACEDLIRTYDIPKTTAHVETAKLVPATATEPEHCDVSGYVEAAVQFRVKLPTTTYTGRYLQLGCGGFCGVIEDPAFPKDCLPRGGQFAVAATDDGHVGTGAFPMGDGTWAANNQAARDDYFYRAPHVVSLASKKIIATFYGNAPKHSYFSGCSNGGREALLLAQRYPDDFDGIVAGAPAAYMGPLVLHQAWLSRSNTAADGSSILTPAKLPVLHNAVLKACDSVDGLADGQIDDPRRCDFDPDTVRCAGADQPTCLTAAQVDAAKKLYAGPTDERGRRLYPGGESYGSELAWNGWVLPFPGVGSVSAILADNGLKHIFYPIGKPSSSLADVKFTRAEFDRLTAEGHKANALSLDLDAFRRAGGKLVLWHGWSDEAIPPLGTLDYYQRLTQRSGGPARTQQWARLFMPPSMFHCAGGDTLTEFDPLKETAAWVERGHAPERVIATGRDSQGQVTRTRPVFPYPLRARYDGSGSVDDASNFVPAPPSAPLNDAIDWVGTYLHHIPGPRA